MSDDDGLSLLEFAAVEYARRGWRVPDLHLRMLAWLEATSSEPSRVLEVFRGAGKSTLLGVFSAWRLYRSPTDHLLIQGADESLALDLSRDTLSICDQSSLMADFVHPTPAAGAWWSRVGRRRNARVPQVRARGITARVTGARAHEIINDDVEVPRTVETAEARLRLRKRLTEQTHVLLPGGTKTFIGTPHAHDSLYAERIKAGDAHLVIPLFARQRRFEPPLSKRLQVPGPVSEDGIWVFAGIGAHARLLVEGQDYTVDGDCVVLAQPLSQVLDVCTGNAWPERFDRRELLRRRREVRSLNEWDSQYQLEAKPVGDVRLDPSLITPYDLEPEIRFANGSVAMQLGGVQIVSATLRLDPASGKPKSDVSALCLVLQDELGRLYWHRAIGLLGDIAEVDEKGAIRGGQVEQIADVIEKFQLPCIVIETNGIGKYAPAILRGALRKRGIHAAVREVTTSVAKNRRILAAIEPPLRSGVLWAHTSVLDVVEAQMRDWNPAVSDQADDFLDCVAGAIDAEPVRIGRLVGKLEGRPMQDWRPDAGTFEVEFDQSEGLLAEVRRQMA